MQKHLLLPFSLKLIHEAWQNKEKHDTSNTGSSNIISMRYKTSATISDTITIQSVSQYCTDPSRFCVQIDKSIEQDFTVIVQDFLKNLYHKGSELGGQHLQSSKNASDMIGFSALRGLDLKMFLRPVKVTPYNLVAVVKILSNYCISVWKQHFLLEQVICGWAQTFFADLHINCTK